MFDRKQVCLVLDLVMLFASLHEQNNSSITPLKSVTLQHLCNWKENSSVLQDHHSLIIAQLCYMTIVDLHSSPLHDRRPMPRVSHRRNSRWNQLMLPDLAVVWKSQTLSRVWKYLQCGNLCSVEISVVWKSPLGEQLFPLQRCMFVTSRDPQWGSSPNAKLPVEPADAL